MLTSPVRSGRIELSGDAVGLRIPCDPSANTHQITIGSLTAAAGLVDVSCIATDALSVVAVKDGFGADVVHDLSGDESTIIIEKSGLDYIVLDATDDGETYGIDGTWYYCYRGS